ncbi:hypothetical protein DEU56DRAFT_529208 [Suillus clintonianus]|uniref:uncharacterized protein n=1 Tax=Suillus clintonianus TaxID=1904413 RepID=UPI001B8627CD|nr:uncharacterized protein DEU56DRAFT_529208 [Suillus clintonianus]KAG2127511.1 hypothetical protein DEU56DRAFT_529208 [Suillus clintonianus]
MSMLCFLSFYLSATSDMQNMTSWPPSHKCSSTGVYILHILSTNLQLINCNGVDKSFQAFASAHPIRSIICALRSRQRTSSVHFLAVCSSVLSRIV